MPNYTGGHTGGLSPSAVKTAVDGFMFDSEQERSNQPSYVGATNGLFFKTSSIDLRAFIFEEDAGVPNLETVPEQAEIPTVNTFTGNQKTINLVKRAFDLPVSWEAFTVGGKGAQKRQVLGSQIADAVVRSRDTNALVTTYGDAFDGAYNTCPDGVALASNSHVTLRGNTVDNLVTGALTPDVMWSGFVAMQQQLGQTGEVAGYLPAGVLTSSTQYKLVKEILKSEKIAESAENNLNVFDTDYGPVAIGQSPFLNSARDGGTYKATAAHIVSREHNIMRKVYADYSSEMIEPKYTRTHSYVYRALYDETAFPGGYSGYVGLTGA